MIQPIALSDVVRYLIRAMAVEPGIYEIGGADVTSYRKMIVAYAEVRGLRARPIFDAPYLTPRLSSYWLDLVTPVDRHVSHALIESLATEVVVHDRERTDAAFGIRPIGLTGALSAALDDQALALDRDLFNCDSGLQDGVYTVRVSLSLPDDIAGHLDADLDRIGGTYSWYGLALGWRLRAALGRLAGEHWELRVPPAIVEGEVVDSPARSTTRSRRTRPTQHPLGTRRSMARLSVRS